MVESEDMFYYPLRSIGSRRLYVSKLERTKRVEGVPWGLDVPSLRILVLWHWQ